MKNLLEDNEKYETDVHRELLALAKYFKDLIEAKIRNGKSDSVSLSELKLIEKVPVLVEANITAHRSSAEIIAKRERELNDSRLQADCPECKELRTVLIVKETSNKNTGWKLDVVECSVCKTRFTNFYPNNMEDRVKFQENFFTKLFEVGSDDKTIAEKLDNIPQESYSEAMHAYKQFRKAIADEEKIISELKVIGANSDREIEKLYDILLVAKTKGQSWGNINFSS